MRNEEEIEIQTPVVEIESEDGTQTLIVTLKAFDLIYSPAGYRLTNEIDIDESDVENVGATQDSGSGSAAVGSRIRRSNKTKDS